MASRRRSTFRSKIQEELICAICLDFLQEPKILSCAHSFCKGCLDGIVTTQSFYKYGPGGDLKKDELECPSCRHITRLVSGKLDELNTNYNLKRLVDIVSDDEKKIARDALQMRRNSRPSIRKSPSLCTQHHRHLEYFCLECSELLCPRCIGSDHKGHDFKDVDEVLPEQIDLLRALIQPACEVASRAESSIDHLFQVRDVVTQNRHDTIDAVKAYFDTIRCALNEREAELTSTAQKYCDIRLTRLDLQYQMLEEHRTKIFDKVAEIESVVESNDNVALLCKTRPLSEELEVHEQSVVSLCEALEESKAYSSSLSFIGSEGVADSVGQVGVVSEHQKEAGSLFVSVRQLIVSKDEDPYLDVPGRFEDLGSDPQKQMRFDESHKTIMEYEPDTKPLHISASETYNVPRTKPQVPPRKSSGSDSVKPLPPIRSHARCIDRESTPPKPPKLPPQTGFETYDVPPPRPRKRSDQANMMKSATLQAHVVRGTMRSLSQPHLQLLNQGTEREDSDSSNDEEYESLDDIPPPTPTPRTKPPPLPPNHPSIDLHNNDTAESKPVPKPRKRRDPKETETEVPKQKKRSNTLPPSILAHSSSGNTTTVLQPLYVLERKHLSWPFNEETVYPVGVCCCVGIHDTLVVTDVFNHCLRLIDQNGTFIEKIGSEGRSGGQFKEPAAVTVDVNDHIFVTERDNPRVQKFTANGRYVCKFGHRTLLGSQLSDPLGVAISSNGCVVVADWDKSQILFFSSNGKLIKTLGKDSSTSFFKFPAAITFNKSGELLVADRGNHCVWVLTAGGDLIQKIGSHGSNPGQLAFPFGVALTDDGRILVSESGNHRISVFSPTGNFMRCFGGHGSEPGMFDHPRHICLNSRSQLFVADEMNQRVQVFQI